MQKTKFLNPESVLFQTGLHQGEFVVDLGAGSGHYALAAAKIVGQNGQVHVVDVMNEPLDHIAGEARIHGIKNIITHKADLESKTLPDRLPQGQSDLVLVANVMHQIKDKNILMKHVYALLKTGGKVLIIDWNDQPSPIGPKVGDRIAEADVKKLSQDSGFKSVRPTETDAYHFGLMFEK